MNEENNKEKKSFEENGIIYNVKEYIEDKLN
jgi:hypothetical protein